MSELKIGQNIRCRTCFDDCENMHFYALSEYSEEYDMTLADLLGYITAIDIKINVNDLPNEICGNCTQHLQSAYAFVLQAQKVNEELTRYAKHKVKEYSNEDNDCLLESPIDLPNDLKESVESKKETVEIWRAVGLSTNDLKTLSDYNGKSDNRKPKSGCNTKKQNKTTVNYKGIKSTLLSDMLNSTQSDFYAHIRMLHLEKSNFDCLCCTRKFLKQENLHNHLQKHGIAKSSIETAKCLTKATNSSNGPKQIMCKVCNLHFSSIASLQAHLQHLHCSNEASLDNYSIINSSSFELHIDDSDTDDEHNERQYICEICEIKCKRKYELTKHQREMHFFDELPYKCEKCIFKTVSQDILKHHIDNQCNNVKKRFECDKCFFKFMWEENLELHKYLLHNICEIEKEINYNEYENNQDESANLSLLKISKKPVKKHLCTICGKTFARNANFKLHMRRHIGDKPYKCEYCDKRFVNTQELQSHHQTHTGLRTHKCNVCEKHFRNAHQLKLHMPTHTGIRPFKCTYCDKSFGKKTILTEHVNRHIGVRPYVCGICGESFVKSGALSNHRRRLGHKEPRKRMKTCLFQGD